MALRDHMLWGFLSGKPVTLGVSGTAAAFAAGDRVFQRKGTNPELVKAVKLSIVNNHKRQQRRIRAIAAD